MIKKIINIFYLTVLLVRPAIGSESSNTLKIGGIPDQNPEKLNRLYKLLTSELSKDLKIKVKYIPVTNYAAAVTAFRTGSIDLAWFGGLTGVQARIQKPGAIIIGQRDIDKKFTSVFIANKLSGINKIQRLKDLKQLKGKRFTFGSQSSTSGRLMPQYYLQKAGVELSDFAGGSAGFSGSHDATIALVRSGAYDSGALNSQVWYSNKQKMNNLSKIKVIWVTPTYNDYHWLCQPDLDERFGYKFTSKLKKWLLSLDKSNIKHKQILSMYGANKFVSAKSSEFNKIEAIGRQLGKIN